MGLWHIIYRSQYRVLKYMNYWCVAYNITAKPFINNNIYTYAKEQGAANKEQRKCIFDKRKPKPKLRFVFRFLLDQNRKLDFWFRFRFGRNSLSTWNFSQNSLSSWNFGKNSLNNQNIYLCCLKMCHLS